MADGKPPEAIRAGSRARTKRRGTQVPRPAHSRMHAEGVVLIGVSEMQLYLFPPSSRALAIVALKNHLTLDCELIPIDLGAVATSALKSISPSIGPARYQHSRMMT